MRAPEDRRTHRVEYWVAWLARQKPDTVVRLYRGAYDAGSLAPDELGIAPERLAELAAAELTRRGIPPDQYGRGAFRRDPERPGVQLVGRVEEYDLIRGGRLYVEGRGHFHFRPTDWRGGGRGPVHGQTVAFRPTASGVAVEVRP